MNDEIFRNALTRLLSSSELKDKLFSVLESEVKKTDSGIDDAILAAFEAVYDVIVPVIIDHRDLD